MNIELELLTRAKEFVKSGGITYICNALDIAASRLSYEHHTTYRYTFYDTAQMLKEHVIRRIGGHRTAQAFLNHPPAHEVHAFRLALLDDLIGEFSTNQPTQLYEVKS